MLVPIDLGASRFLPKHLPVEPMGIVPDFAQVPYLIATAVLHLLNPIYSSRLQVRALLLRPCSQYVGPAQSKALKHQGLQQPLQRVQVRTRFVAKRNNPCHCLGAHVYVSPQCR